LKRTFPNHFINKKRRRAGQTNFTGQMQHADHRLVTPSLNNCEFRATFHHLAQSDENPRESFQHFLTHSSKSLILHPGIKSCQEDCVLAT